MEWVEDRSQDSGLRLPFCTEYCIAPPELYHTPSDCIVMKSLDCGRTPPLNQKSLIHAEDALEPPNMVLLNLILFVALAEMESSCTPFCNGADALLLLWFSQKPFVA